MSEGAINFYEREYYVLSNFSSFQIEWRGQLWPTSEHAYHAEKFEDPELREHIRLARSAHDAYRIAQQHKQCYRKNWDKIKLGVMKLILHEKVAQHEYVRRKLLESGNRELVEMSWRDDFWGWGPNKDGANHLGRLWMEIRDELRSEMREAS